MLSSEVFEAFNSEDVGVIHLAFVGIGEAFCGREVKTGLKTSEQEVLDYLPECDGGSHYCSSCGSQYLGVDRAVVDSWREVK